VASARFPDVQECANLQCGQVAKLEIDAVFNDTNTYLMDIEDFPIWFEPLLLP